MNGRKSKTGSPFNRLLLVLSMLAAMLVRLVQHASIASADASADAAVTWAENLIGNTVAGTTYDGKCLLFVHDAYSMGANVEIGSSATAVTYWNGHTSAQHAADTSPPAGALVFWGATTTAMGYGLVDNPDGHVAIAEGGDTVVSSYERANHAIHTFTISGRNAAHYPYLGWMMPTGVVAGGSGGGGAPSKDYNHDGHSDLYQVTSNNSGSGKAEAHILNGINFNTSLLDIATGAGQASTADVRYLTGDYNNDGNLDLYIIAHDHTGSGHTEIHILSGPSFQASLGDWVTPWGDIGSSQAEYALGDYNHDGYSDLYMAVFNGTGSGKTEIFVLGGTNFQTTIGAWATIAGMSTTDRVEFVLGDYNSDGYPDAYLAYLSGTGSGKVEVFVLNGTNFQSFLGSWATISGPTSTSQLQIQIGDYNADHVGDLYMIYFSGTGSGKVEVFVLNGTNFQSFLGSWATIWNTVPSTQSEFALG